MTTYENRKRRIIRKTKVNSNENRKKRRLETQQEIENNLKVK